MWYLVKKEQNNAKTSAKKPSFVQSRFQTKDEQKVVRVIKIESCSRKEKNKGNVGVAILVTVGRRRSIILGA
jgi:hypothetical protein